MRVELNTGSTVADHRDGFLHGNGSHVEVHVGRDAKVDGDIGTVRGSNAAPVPT